MTNMLLALTPSGEDPAVYGPDKSNYSPALSGPTPTGNPLPVAVHRLSAAGIRMSLPTAHVPAPPDPATGGESGVPQQLGWSTGIHRDRSMHQRFTGRTLQGSPMGPNRKTGNVGLFDPGARRAAGVGALLNDFTPTNDVVSAAFGYTVKPNAISDETAALR